MKKETVLRIVDACFHEFASDYRIDAKNKASKLYEQEFDLPDEPAGHVGEEECYNCHDKVKMVSKGEFCPHCMCDQ